MTGSKKRDTPSRTQQSAGPLIRAGARLQNPPDTPDEGGGSRRQTGQAAEQDLKQRRAIYYWRLVRELPWLVLRYRL